MTATLSDAEGMGLLRVARLGLEAHLDGRPVPTSETLFEGDVPPALRSKRGAFVTWKKHTELRGCIGYTAGASELWRDVQDLAVGAAMRDSRFQPVTRDEYQDLDLSVTVLTPAHPIRPEEVEVGRHGLIIALGSHRGLLLPQVPVEWGWDRTTFLERTCRKAGLPADAWKQPDARLEGFEGQVFYEVAP